MLVTEIITVTDVVLLLDTEILFFVVYGYWDVLMGDVTFLDLFKPKKKKSQSLVKLQCCVLCYHSDYICTAV